MYFQTEHASRLYSGFLRTAASANAYFKTWTYGEPFAVSSCTNQKFLNIQKLLYKCILYFAQNYDQYRHLMPVSDRVNEILSLCGDKEYRAGTYRADFIIEPDNSIRIIEMNCRFPLNGFFITGFFNLVADAYAEANGLLKIDDYTPFFDYLFSYFGNVDSICILKKDSETRNETRYIEEVFTDGGFPVSIIPTDKIAESLPLLKNAAVISELDHNDLFSLPQSIVDEIIHANSLNDLRTVFLIHDKRFFSVLSHDEFLADALPPGEVEEIKKYLVPTYTFGERPDLWLTARQSKAEWILKPCVFGKSKNVFAGKVTGEEEWQQLFQTGMVADMVLQPFIEQRMFDGVIGSQAYHDFVVGTLLFFNDQFFGPGIFRASSYPVTNILDDRKAAPFVTEDTSSFSCVI